LARSIRASELETKTTRTPAVSAVARQRVTPSTSKTPAVASAQKPRVLPPVSMTPDVDAFLKLRITPVSKAPKVAAAPKPFAAEPTKIESKKWSGVVRRTDNLLPLAPGSSIPRLVRK